MEFLGVGKEASDFEVIESKGIQLEKLKKPSSSSFKMLPHVEEH